jgi:hypothetical protein
LQTWLPYLPLLLLLRADRKFFAECGWQLLVRYSLTQCTHAYGWDVLHTAASMKRSDSQQVQYVVGVVMK